MSAPLTIDELRALKAGDWVWVIIKQPVAGDLPHDGRYYQSANYEFMKNKNKGHVFNGYSRFYPYSAYGTKWIAYKNKEQAESKGEIVELPCLRDKPSLHTVGNEWIKRKELNYMTKDKTICSIVYWENEFDEAERRLAELKGEQI